MYFFLDVYQKWRGEYLISLCRETYDLLYKETIRNMKLLPRNTYEKRILKFVIKSLKYSKNGKMWKYYETENFIIKYSEHDENEFKN